MKAGKYTPGAMQWNFAKGEKSNYKLRRKYYKSRI